MAPDGSLSPSARFNPALIRPGPEATRPDPRGSPALPGSPALARIYEGNQDHPVGPTINPAPVPQTAPEPGQDSRAPVTFPASDLKTALIALEIAADYKRDRAEICADCPDQSCPDCQSRLDDARAYDQIADRMLQAAEAAPAAHHSQTEPAGPARHSGPAVGREAGQ